MICDDNRIVVYARIA